MAISCVLIQICFIQIIPERAIRSSDPPGNPREFDNFRQFPTGSGRKVVAILGMGFRKEVVGSDSRKTQDPTGSDKNFIAKLATN
jgi:hypothetical protein